MASFPACGCRCHGYGGLAGEKGAGSEAPLLECRWFNARRAVNCTAAGDSWMKTPACVNEMPPSPSSQLVRRWSRCYAACPPRRSVTDCTRLICSSDPYRPVRRKRRRRIPEIGRNVVDVTSRDV